MRPGKEPKRRSRPSSPLRDRTKVPSGFEPRSPGSRSSVSVLDRELLADDIAGLEGLSISSDPSNSNPIPRSFPCSVKQQCWDKAEKIKGRDPDRWRRDPFGNIVFRKLMGCSGCSVMTMITFYLTLRDVKAHWKTVKFCRPFRALEEDYQSKHFELSKKKLSNPQIQSRPMVPKLPLLPLISSSLSLEAPVVLDGTWGTVKGSSTTVRDFADMCYHSYPLYLKELRESPDSNEIQTLRYCQANCCSWVCCICF